MNQSKKGLNKLYSALGGRLNLFLLLAVVPIAAIFYFVPLSAIVPFYGFLLLLIKSQKLQEFQDAATTQKAFGLIIVAGSFLAYFAVVRIFPDAAYYTNANYVIYLLGLFLIFFQFKALKEAFAPLLLVTAATLSALMSETLKPYLSPYAKGYGYMIAGLLRLIGIKASTYNLQDAAVITFPSASGAAVAGAFVYECIGVSSMLVFSIILIVILAEDPSSPKAKLVYSIVGLVGTFAVNIVRATGIFVTDYFYGMEAGGTVHYVIGYILFSIWLVAFLYLYSKRQILNTKFSSAWRKIT